MTEWLEFHFPDELTMLELLGVFPRKNDEGLWEYEITDAKGVTLKLSFNVIEKYFQAILSINENVLQSITQDGLWTLSPLISGTTKGLRAEANYEKSFTVVDIFWDPSIRISWRTARL